MCSMMTTYSRDICISSTRNSSVRINFLRRSLGIDESLRLGKPSPIPFARAPQDFVLIIDEAHRGATANDRNRTTIMQKFIVGSPVDEMPSVPLVLGMSATPQRFTTLLGNTNRTQRPINIDP